MSLGLKDLKPRKSAKTNAEKYPAGAWARTYTARPWTQSDLSKSPRGRKRVHNADAAMNEEWINICAKASCAFDLSHGSILRNVQIRMVTAEKRLQTMLDSSKSIWRNLGQFLTSKS